MSVAEIDMASMRQVVWAFYSRIQLFSHFIQNCRNPFLDQVKLGSNVFAQLRHEFRKCILNIVKKLMPTSSPSSSSSLSPVKSCGAYSNRKPDCKFKTAAAFAFCRQVISVLTTTRESSFISTAYLFQWVSLRMQELVRSVSLPTLVALRKSLSVVSPYLNPGMIWEARSRKARASGGISLRILSLMRICRSWTTSARALVKPTISNRAFFFIGFAGLGNDSK
ncbi:unnamed protein product [Ectocarpus sp. 4 AP-2014]